MTLPRLAATNGRAVVLVTALLALAGLLTGRSLPSSIYPPLQFPRALVIARSGTLPARSMIVDVTRPLEQAAMEVPGIRRNCRIGYPKYGRRCRPARSSRSNA
jgi:multidrug efflux pump subunit AcrB